MIISSFVALVRSLDSAPPVVFDRHKVRLQYTAPHMLIGTPAIGDYLKLPPPGGGKFFSLA